MDFNNWKHIMYHGMNIIKIFSNRINDIFVSFPLSCLKQSVVRTLVCKYLLDLGLNRLIPTVDISSTALKLVLNCLFVPPHQICRL